MRRQEVIKTLGITNIQFHSITRSKQFKKKFRIIGSGFHHEYGEEELKAIKRVIEANKEWIKARKFV